MKKIRYMLILLISLGPMMSQAINITVDHQGYILDIKDNLYKLSHDINRLERDYNLSLSNQRALKLMKPSFFKLRNQASNLYDNVVINGYDDNGRDINLRTIRGDVQFLADQLNFIVSNYDLEKIFKKRSLYRYQEVAYHIEKMLDAVYDESSNESLSPISSLSKGYKQRNLEFIIQGEYELFFRKLQEVKKLSKKAISSFRKKGRLPYRRSEKMRFRKKSKYQDFINRLRSINQHTDQILEDLEQTLSNDERVNKDFLIISLDNINTELEAFITQFNNRNMTDIDLKIEVLNLNETLYESISLITKNEKKKKKITGLETLSFDFENEQDVCETVSSPGQILLQKSKSSRTSLFTEFGVSTSRGIQLLELMKFEDTDIDYSHAELISEINSKHDIQSWSYYPWMFNRNKQETEHRPPFVNVYQGWKWCAYRIDNNGRKVQDCKSYNKSYRSNYTIFNVRASSLKNERKLKEKALTNINDKSDFFRKGLAVCSDFINWAFGNIITSNWNFIPGIKHIVQAIYIPEGWQTPDNLADSYMTEKVCDVEKDELIYPKKVNLHRLVNTLNTNSKSDNHQISSHADRIINKLMKKGIISRKGEPLGDVLIFTKKENDLLDW